MFIIISNILQRYKKIFKIHNSKHTFFHTKQNTQFISNTYLQTPLQLDLEEVTQSSNRSVIPELTEGSPSDKKTPSPYLQHTINIG